MVISRLLHGLPLPKFTERTLHYHRQQFEADIGSLGIPLSSREGDDHRKSPEIVLDKKGLFWIFIYNDGIYRYDPVKQIVERQVDLPKMELSQPILSLDGTIYFQDPFPFDKEAFLYQFDPRTKEIIAIDLPKEPWSLSGNMLVDQKGRLWLGSMGYRDTDGSWHFIDPDPQKVVEHMGDPVWFPPSIIFESSNGILWYMEWHDMELKGEGTAWYDPETGEGSLFTNMASFIVEDSQKQLWLAVAGKLYRYPLEQ